MDEITVKVIDLVPYSVEQALFYLKTGKVIWRTTEMTKEDLKKQYPDAKQDTKTA